METASGSVPLERRSSLTAPAEFGLIARCFAPLAGPAGLGLLDDAALLAPPPGRELVISADALVAGVHFLPDDPADLIARKLLRANLSDLAAKGAVPLGYLLTVAAPRATPEAWFSAFAAGLALDQAEYGVTLLGGDTTSTPGPVCLSLTILGHVAPGAMVRRSGARAGDGIWVTGTIGDAALGLAVARAGAGDAFLLDRYRLPRPRVGFPLAGIASAAMDVSDGLVQDLGHLCRASSLGARIDAARVPLSPAAAAASDLLRCLVGGDDYEILMAVPHDRTERLLAAAAGVGVPVSRIGAFAAGGPDVAVENAPPGLSASAGGWSHF
jgi:thiamine-monophosphate kinase